MDPNPLAYFEGRLRPVLENARQKIREHIEKKAKIDVIAEDTRSIDTKEKIEELEAMMLRVDDYLDEIFGDFIRAVAAVQH